MGDKLSRFTSAFKDAATRTAKTASDLAQHENTQAALKWTKKAAESAADEATAIRKRVTSTPTGKSAATGALAGAALAVPIPLIGPVAGALVGGGIGALLSLRGSPNSQPASTHEATPQETVHVDLYKRLTELDDLRQKGLLSEEEFTEQKAKLLKRI